MKLFGKKISFSAKKKIIPDGLWNKCPKCSKMVFSKELNDNLKVCPHCNFHYNMTAWERAESLADKGTFQEFDADISRLKEESTVKSEEVNILYTQISYLKAWKKVLENEMEEMKGKKEKKSPKDKDIKEEKDIK